MAEAESLSSKLTIPEDWNFPEKYDPTTLIRNISVDETQGYLAFSSNRKDAGI